MTRTATLGLVLLVAGLLMLAWPVISYTDRDEVADFGPIEIAVEERESISLPPILGGVAAAAGLVLLITGLRPTRA
jgi:hypothetical protein